MSHSQDRPHPSDEFSEAQELLARTVRFLEHCNQDPEAALEAEDTGDLIRGLESLRMGPVHLAKPAPTPESSPEPIQIRRRRSA